MGIDHDRRFRHLPIYDGQERNPNSFQAPIVYHVSIYSSDNERAEWCTYALPFNALLLLTEHRKLVPTLISPLENPTL